MGIEVTSLSETGAKREVNQDSILIYQNQSLDFHVFVVADGMGGYADGEKASQYITGDLGKWLAAEAGTTRLRSPTALFTGLGERLTEINRYIHEEMNQGKTCGSTCVLLFLCEGMYGVLSVGDSRIYRARTFLCEQITHDDVWENLPEIRARLSLAQRRANSNFGKLTRTVGTKETFAYSMDTGRLGGTDIFALCSDGVYKMVPEDFLKKELRSAVRKDLDRVRDEIREEVYRRGARDNLSLILVRYTR